MLPLCINQNTLNTRDWLEWTSPLTTIISSQPCQGIVIKLTIYGKFTLRDIKYNIHVMK